jgi:hypothetical protein
MLEDPKLESPRLESPRLEKDTLIKTSRLVVHTGFILNRIFLAAVALGLLLSWLFRSQLAHLLLQQDPGTDVHSQLTGLRLMMLVGIVMSVASDRLLVALTHIIDTAQAGDPFIAANARRLQTIGWALLVLQLLDIPASLIEKYFPGMGMGTPDAPFSLAGWMAVLMVFVLSRVFAVGAAMRDDLEGTV